jgi:hypothetical protein
MNGILTRKEISGGRYWCFASASNGSAEPIKTTLYWIMSDSREPILDSLSDGIPAEYHDGIVSARDPRYWASHDTLRYQLPGNKQADLVVNEPIPCPQVRKGIETRYRYGKWEKYLKATGWISA